MRVEQALLDAGLTTRVVELDQSTRTAELAAIALGVPLGSIVKSLIFMADGKPVLALVAGDRRAAPDKVAAASGAIEARLARADEVRSITGFAIGGVPPLGHDLPMAVLIDQSLGRFATVNAAAGSPRAVFPVAFAELVRVSQGRICDVVEPGA